LFPSPPTFRLSRSSPMGFEKNSGYFSKPIPNK